MKIKNKKKTKENCFNHVLTKFTFKTLPYHKQNFLSIFKSIIKCYFYSIYLKSLYYCSKFKDFVVLKSFRSSRVGRRGRVGRRKQASYLDGNWRRTDLCSDCARLRLFGLVSRVGTATARRVRTLSAQLEMRIAL